jgi:kumamolisin
LSWGEPEIGVSDNYVRLVDEAMQAAAHLGITVCASSGDAGALNHSPDHLPTVNFPASSPHCLGCGGTMTKFANAAIAEEAAWNSSHYGIEGATGGGVSRRFSVPAWQRHADVPKGPTGGAGRGVPDVAGPADPRSGFEILVAGESCVSAGTSAVAPLWASLIARCNQALGARCGYINPLLYKVAKHPTGAKALQVVRSGNNGVYEARDGWSACTGLGTPRGSHLLTVLKDGLG